MDDDERAMIEEGNAPAVSVEEPLPPRPQDAQVRVEEEDEEPMRIVKDYQRPTAKYALHLRSLAVFSACTLEGGKSRTHATFSSSCTVKRVSKLIAPLLITILSSLYLSKSSSQIYRK